MRIAWPLLPALLLSLAASTRAQAQVPAVNMLVYPNAGVFEIVDGRISGPGEAMLMRLQAISGVQHKQQVMPIARVLQTLATKPDTCAVSLPRTADREAHFRWTTPWIISAITLYGRAQETRQITGPEDLLGTQVAVLRESLPAAWLKDHGVTGYEVNDMGTGLRMLQAGRIDFWLGSEVSARLAIRAMQGPAPRPLYSYGRLELHMACHLSTEAAIVERLNAGLEQMRREGELAEFGAR